MADGPASHEPPSSPESYDLAIDEQVEKFVEIKQKLTYFLITASSAVTAFLVTFVVDHHRDPREVPLSHLALVSGAVVAGLCAAGSSLVNLRLEHRSHELHLQTRYERKTWDSLHPDVQRAWDRLGVNAARFLTTAFVSLFVQILFSATFFIFFFS